MLQINNFMCKHRDGFKKQQQNSRYDYYIIFLLQYYYCLSLHRVSTMLYTIRSTEHAYIHNKHWRTNWRDVIYTRIYRYIQEEHNIPHVLFCICIPLNSVVEICISATMNTRHYVILVKQKSLTLTFNDSNTTSPLVRKAAAHTVRNSLKYCILVYTVVNTTCIH